MAVRTVYIELRATAEKLRADMAAAGKEVVAIGKDGEESGKRMARGMNDASLSLKKVAETAAEATLAMAGAYRTFTGGLSAYAAAAATASGSTEELITGLRALRIAASAAFPATFGSVGLATTTVAVGILAEETIKLVNVRAKLIAQQSLISATSGFSLSSVQRLDAAANISGGDSGSLHNLSSTLASRMNTDRSAVNSGLGALGLSADDPDLLRKIAAGFDSMEDPAKRAAAAVRIFGSANAGEAIKQLNAAFVESSEVVARYGLVLDSLSAKQISRLSSDLKGLLAPFRQLKEEAAGSAEATKNYFEVIGGAIDDMAHRAVPVLDNLLRKVPGISALTGLVNGQQSLSLKDLAARVNPEIDARMTADDLFAQSQVAHYQQTQTLEGRRSAQAAAQQRADAAYAALTADNAKRQADPHDSSVLTGPQRLQLTTAQQAAAAVAAAIAGEIASLESALKVSADHRTAGAEGAGYNAKRAADVQNQTSREVAESGGSAAGISSRLYAQYDAAHKIQVSSALAALQEQIDKQRELTRAQGQGADAVSKLELAEKIRRITLDNDAESAKKLIAAEKELYETRQTREIGEERQSISDKTEHLNRLTGAIPQGDDAVSAVENDYRDENLSRAGKGDLIRPQHDLDDAEKRHQAAVQAAADAKSAAQDEIDAQVTIAEIKDRSSGDVKDLELQGRKLTLERLYSQNLTHTFTEQISNLAQVSALEEKAREARITGLQAEFDEADQYSDPAEEIKAAKIQAEIAKLKQQSANATVESQTKISSLVVDQQRIAVQAGGGYQQRLKQLAEEVSALNSIKVTSENILDIDASRRALADQLLEATVQQRLAVGDLASGWDAFFLSMQEQAEKPGKILYDGMHAAVDGLSEDLAKLAMGKVKKGGVGKMFGGTLESVGQGMAQSSIKSIMQRGLGALGKHMGISGPGKPDGTQTNPYYAVLLPGGINRTPGTAPVLGGVANAAGAAATGGIMAGIGGFLGKLFGRTGGAGIPSVTSSISFMANGGDADPGRIYGVAEAGEAELISPKNSSRITPISKLGGGDTYHEYTIDARGADLGAENRVMRAIELSHNAAVSNSVRANSERSKRTPQRSR